MNAAIIILIVVLVLVALAIITVVVLDLLKVDIKFKFKRKSPAKSQRKKSKNVKKPKPVMAAEKPTVAAEPAPEKPAEPEQSAAPEKPAEIAEPVQAVQAVQTVTNDEPDDDSADGADDTDETEEDGESERKLVVDNGEVKYIVIKYAKSFQAKLIQSGSDTKAYYSQLKNCLLSYKGVKSRMSWRWETFRLGRKALAKLVMRGKTLSVALALNPDDYADTKYIVESLAEVASYAETQCLYRIKNDRRVKYAKDLIDKVMQDNGLSAGLINADVDYAAQYPYETTEALIERKLIKVLTDEDAQSGTVFKPSDVRGSVTAAEVDKIMRDEVAEILIEKAEETSDRTKVGIVNIDALSQVFADGDTVTLEEVKKRVKGFDNKVTYLKVLARGTLDKKLTVKSDAFSLQAAKMIILTGGKVIKK